MCRMLGVFGLTFGAVFASAPAIIHTRMLRLPSASELAKNSPTACASLAVACELISRAVVHQFKPQCARRTNASNQGHNESHATEQQAPRVISGRVDQMSTLLSILLFLPLYRCYQTHAYEQYVSSS